MQRLEKCYSGRLRITESRSLSLRKKLAPRIARLALESRSLRDFVVHGQPSPLTSFFVFLSNAGSAIKVLVAIHYSVLDARNGYIRNVVV